ncbi:carboxymuconolactone decarboxylase family protein [Buchananella hordeovulneris]|uniref:Alkylhydroperoxidase n=1 Tax=Buchananella hordeovulneris TaxID=52770 RepID=A0A1Q5PYD4_9ACTO|nr:carboxymuconolactone decarboxylase family protein [Buchananella hordeovulneris]MDO5079691.1 carboxymuconolactone decarboxylase family protein [Buchananella hordeovulneris]OKL52400.1 alkylhydroperoxidase [Buchananella hordeovulneris]RRD45411.1 carboxymuconolactone decarboxylase family protein [Buchananella hordeovulneris]RRD53830.1 carboxymuconolactone decarboxylase family protein [Buchananella hordeovulneris]
MAAVNVMKEQPSSLQALTALTKETDAVFEQAGLSRGLAELIKVRVSQLNGCAYCLRSHVQAAQAAGEDTDRLTLLSAWWETQVYTEQERAALALAEQVTRLAVPEDRSWDTGVLTPQQVSAVIWVATVIGAWNRVVLSSHPAVKPVA